jgi:hypothetical protein
MIAKDGAASEQIMRTKVRKWTSCLLLQWHGAAGPEQLIVGALAAARRLGRIVLDCGRHPGAGLRSSAP